MAVEIPQGLGQLHENGTGVGFRVVITLQDLKEKFLAPDELHDDD